MDYEIHVLNNAFLLHRPGIQTAAESMRSQVTRVQFVELESSSLSRTFSDVNSSITPAFNFNESGLGSTSDVHMHFRSYQEK